MSAQAGLPDNMLFRPVTAERWPDLVELFGPRGACAGCWCMFSRLERKAWEAGRKGGGEGNKRAMRELIGAGTVPGLLAYAGDEPVGWISLGPRESFTMLARSRVMAPVDSEPVWSVVCLFIRRDWRRRGLSLRLINAAADYARSEGAQIIEAYPLEPTGGKTADAFAWYGIASAYRAAGFREVARRSPKRPVMRRVLK